MSAVLIMISMLAASMLVAVVWFVMASRPVVGVQCPQCGYDLRGSRRSRHCPECGASNGFIVIPHTPFTLLKLRRLLGDVRDANHDADSTMI